MRIARKLLLLALTATAAMAMATGTASALTVSGEPTTTCTNVPAPVAHVVTGGCHVNFTSEGRVPLFAHIPGTGEVLVSSCFVDLEAQIGGNGEGYVKRATFTLPDANCTRRVCDEANMVFRPWRAHIRETGPNARAVQITFCLRTVPEAEGVAGTNCTLVLPLTTVGGAGHRYEATATSAQRCAENAAVSIAGHFTTPVTGSERIEIVH